MIPAQYYSTVFLYLVIVLTLIAANSVSHQSYSQIRKSHHNALFALALCVALALWIGFRPTNTSYFGDTFSYKWSFYLYQTHQKAIPTYEEGEWLWNYFMYLCAQSIDVSAYLTIVAAGYFGFTLWACKRLMPNNVLVADLFCIGALSFFTYGTNGIRNGLACSIVLLMLAYINGNVRDKIIASILAVVAFHIHKSTALPITMAVLSLFIKSFKTAYIFWVLSILISLVAGGAVTAFFAGLGFDDRVSYLQAEMDSDTFSRTSFRWDFLLYSMMPIVLGYYVVIKRGIRNRTYELFLNTYTLSNAFWVMVIRANYSNRFAYLSWFMYPIVLAYPLLKLDIWGPQQGKKLRLIMLAHIGFTWFMQTLYW